MKIMKILSLMLSGMVAFSAYAADFGGKLYIEDASIAPGESAVLSVQLDNDIEICGFQLQMMLPDGITYSDWRLSENRLPVGAKVRDQFTVQRFDAQKLIVAGVLNHGAGAAFTQTRGELATIVITAAPNLPQGSYIIEVSGIDVSDPMGHDYDAASTTFTLTVGTPTGIETIGMDANGARVYDLQGRHLKTIGEKQAGIVNGQVIYRK